MLETTNCFCVKKYKYKIKDNYNGFSNFSYLL